MVWRLLLDDLENITIEHAVGEWSFVVLFAKADEQQRSLGWGLPDYGGFEPCSECLCDRATRPFTDLQTTARWRLTDRMSCATYMARCTRPPHPLTTCKFITRLFFFLDVMHLMDCKCVSSIVFGSVLHGLVRNPRLGSNIQERLRVINEHRRLWYSQHAGLVTLPVIKESNIGGVAGEWTSLHGLVFKAAITRKATPVFESLARRYLADGSPYEQTQLKICEDLL